MSKIFYLVVQREGEVMEIQKTSIHDGSFISQNSYHVVIDSKHPFEVRLNFFPRFSQKKLQKQAGFRKIGRTQRYECKFFKIVAILTQARITPSAENIYTY